MSAPRMKYGAGVFGFYWDDQQVGMTLDRLKDTNSTIYAEATVKALSPTPMHIIHTKLNMLSGKSKKDLIKELYDRHPQIESWDIMIEQACVMALQKYRQGSPLIKITKNGSTPPEYLAYPLLPEKQTTVLFGDGGSGKSTFTDYLAIVMGLGLDVKSLRVVEDPITSIVLDWETDIDTHKWQIGRICSAMGLDEPPIYYRQCYFSLDEDLPEIQKFIMDVDAKLIILDSAAAACGSDPMSPGVASKFISRDLRQLKTSEGNTITSLIIAHTAKADPLGKERTIYGSVFWKNYARSVWEAIGSEEDDLLTVGLYCRKANLSRKFKPIGFRMEYMDGGIKVLPTKLDEVPQLVSNLRPDDQIEIMLKHGSLTISEIADESGLPKATIKTVLHRNPHKFTKVYKVGKEHQWGLASHEL